MQDICSICLCTGVELQTLEEALNIFYCDLCDIQTDGHVLCCPKCVYLLRKFYNFRNKCQKANYVLQKWKKESKITRIPVDKLNTKLSPTSLGLCNDSDTNHAVYCYNDVEDYTESKSCSGLNNFITCHGKDTEFLKSDNGSEKNFEVKFETAVKIESNDDKYALVEVEELKTEQQNYDDDDDDVDANIYDDIIIISEDINNDHDLLILKKESNKRKKDSEVTGDEPKRKRRKRITKQTKQEITRNVKRRLGKRDVKDKDGNIIDVDVILNHLDVMHKKMYLQIQRYCAGKEPLTSEAIDFLGQIQKRYGNQYSSVFITKHLTTDQEIMEQLKRRETSQDYVQSEHKCLQCFQHFKSAKWLDYHVAQFHDASKPHKCQYCAISFDTRRSFCRHLQTHRVAYQCKLCPLVTHHTSVMAAHFNMHTGVKYPCTKCDAVFKSPPALSSHMNSKHHVVNLICPCCTRKFHSKKGLYQHMMKKHRDDMKTVGPPSAKCEQCDINFISDEVYLDHMRKSHKEVKRKELTKKKIPTDRRYTCRVCKHVESSLGALMWHFKNEHRNETFDVRRIVLRGPHPYLCHECGKGFQSLHTLNDHKNVHSGARPYSCTECPKAFTSRGLLKHHMQYHRPPTYQCPYCDKKFHSGSDVNKHKERHIGRRRACELCDKSFLRQSYLSKHIREVHRQERNPPKQTNVLE